MTKGKKKYIDVHVSKDLLARLQKELDAAVGKSRYVRFKVWLHYANLDSWQQQKWHWAYVNNDDKEWHCTCGLVTPKGAEPEFSGFDELVLDQSHMASGHRALPEFDYEVVAFIFDYTWVEDRRVYFYDALCQMCGAYVLEHPGKKADDFVDEHNMRCGNRLVSQKKNTK
jgi:hypothetical protein